MATNTQQAAGKIQVLSELAAKWLQPRFAMAIALSILSLGILERHSGAPVHTLPVDLSPVRIWDSAEDRIIRVKDRTMKYYENIRFAYQIECLLRDLQEQQETSERQRGNAPRQGRT